jgi:imidazolonepropionase-like amidohydrolase
MNGRNLAFMAGTTAAYGLSKAEALQLVTLNVAKILGLDESLGSLEVGKAATLFISEGDALDMRTQKVEHAFVQGRVVDLEGMQERLFNKYKARYDLNE